MTDYTNQVTFRVHGAIAGTNGAYHPRKGGKGFYRDAKATAFMDNVKREAFVASVTQGWLKLREIGPLEIEVEIVAFGYKGDVDQPIKFVMDSLQGIFYDNDKVVGRVIAEKRFGKPERPFLEVVVRRRNVTPLKDLSA
jgi:Holliday junction resolvase RusA-like endonuclease